MTARLIVIFCSLFVIESYSANFLYAQDKCLEASSKVKQGVSLGNGSPDEEKFYRDAIAECPNMPEAFGGIAPAREKNRRREEWARGSRTSSNAVFARRCLGRAP